MMHDFSKPQPHVASREEIAKKRKLPVYMFADHSANPTAQVMISNLQSVLLNA